MTYYRCGDDNSFPFFNQDYYRLEKARITTIRNNEGGGK